MATRRTFVAGAAGLAASWALGPWARAQAPAKKTLRFGVGPLLPTADDTKKSFAPFFAWLANQLGVDYELSATTDWAGMAVAMGSGQLDLAWMGPWGYVIANNATDCQALATVKYDDKPFYHGIIVSQPGIEVARFPDDTRNMSISFADVGSTSGWLIPTWYAKEVWKIDPKTFWKYTDGATHAANEVAVQSGQVNLATDFDRNRNAMIANGVIKPDGTKIIWTSDPLPNDAIVVPRGTSPELVTHVQQILTTLTPQQAATMLPPRYTGFVSATHASYTTIEQAGIAVGKIHAKT
ncbi:phosphate/phosphite/phosphonate ABC transporter substrate-binding protein [Paraburkholderia sp. DHOC27]|uniref:phosphate/phosphite/phosphonate ABC transporter substrate-binding protein n=1 Tax=Paraburkholderia sp. DHOC27 TaxID=2303330 RepID=UPI000E3D4E7C|nr:phosphate/phosphite/phosphonate ABC transporter substrate-binding protein [Paraburkholderia sp. DHOC27]RFU49873.1 phosphate/phosphite/phosphonate ABC transporter substrate-binding protein [Paraburkholderia sp. DHOC27]